MYKLLIVDDEEIVGKGLKKFVNWEALGYEVISTCTSVDAAEEILNSTPIDVVLTDINMPIRSGLDLLQVIQSDFPNIKSIILSGFEDFAYAQKALRFGCIDYLTKPVNFNELTEVFIKLTDALNMENSKFANTINYMDIQQDILLNNIINGSVNPETIANLKNIKLKLFNKPFYIIRLNISYNIKHYNNFFSIKNIIFTNLTELLDNYSSIHYIINNNTKEFCAIVYPNNIETNLKLSLLEFCQSTLKSTSTKINIGISNLDDNISNIASLYEDSGMALKYSISNASSFVCTYSEISDLNYNYIPINSIDKQNLLHYLSEFDIDGLFLYLNSLYNKLSDNNIIGDNQFYSLSIEVILLLYNYFSNFNLEYKMDFQIESFTQELLNHRNKNNIKDFTLKYISKLTSRIDTNVPTCNNNIIDNAIIFINENFWKDISLNTLSEVLYLHPIYLSKLFKEKTGQNYLKYLTDVRIEKAKTLLNDRTLKIYNITELVGYGSSKYFSKIFKESVGLTPKEYRDSIVLK